MTPFFEGGGDIFIIIIYHFENILALKLKYIMLIKKKMKNILCVWNVHIFYSTLVLMVIIFTAKTRHAKNNKLFLLVS